MLEEDPDNGNATFSLGLVYAEQGKDDDAEDYYNRTLSISPHDRGTLFNLGMLLTQQGRSAISSAVVGNIYSAI